MLTTLGALRVTNVGAWKATLSEALAAAKGNRTHAAKALGVARRTLLRWLEECPELREPATVSGGVTSLSHGNPGEIEGAPETGLDRHGSELTTDAIPRT